MASAYTTSQGETWDAIAKALWGDEKLLHLLVAANPEHRATLLFSAGTVLTVPDVDTETVTTVTRPWES